MRDRSYRRYDATFRQEAIELLKRSDRSATEVAESLGIPITTLLFWYRSEMAKKKGKGKKAPASRSSAHRPPDNPEKETPEETIARLEMELRVLQRKNEELEMDRAILKKAAAFFAKESE
jgi:transposase